MIIIINSFKPSFKDLSRSMRRNTQIQYTLPSKGTEFPRTRAAQAQRSLHDAKQYSAKVGDVAKSDKGRKDPAPTIRSLPPGLRDEIRVASGRHPEPGTRRHRKKLAAPFGTGIRAAETRFVIRRESCERVRMPQPQFRRSSICRETHRASAE